MPRPTFAQLAYGTSTVVCAAVAMLLLSGAGSFPAALAVAAAALAAGVLVAVTLPTHRGTRVPAGTPVRRSGGVPADPPRVGASPRN